MQSDWLKIRSGRDILIYSAWQGLKHPRKFEADHILSFFYHSEKISLDMLCELSGWQVIHVKGRIFFEKKKKKNSKSHLLQLWLGL